jgi:hypothetical protein
MDSILPPPAILASSTSGIPMSRIQSECKHPERCVTGYPFNPPHLIPLVEVIGGAKTSAETIERAMRFYTAIGKRAIHIRKEVAGHVANRLQAALYRGSILSDRSGCGQRGGRRCRSVHGSGSALGSDGTEPDLLPGRRTGWYASLLRAIHGSDDGAGPISALPTSVPNCRKRLWTACWRRPMAAPSRRYPRSVTR